MISLLSSDCHFESLALQGSFRGPQVAKKSLLASLSSALQPAPPLIFLLLHSPS